MHRPEADGRGEPRAPSLEETFYPFVLRRQDSYTAVAPGPTEGGRPLSPGDRILGVRPDRQASWETERELHLAAELGKALLERNEELSRERESEAREWAQRLEAVEQESHEQRRRFEAREGDWAVRLAELEAELAQRSGHWQREHHREQRTRHEAVHHLLTHNQRLVEELGKADTEKDRLRSQLRELKHSLWESSLCQAEHRDQIQKLQAENQRIVERSVQLEQRLQRLSEEKETLQMAFDSLEDNVNLLQQGNREQEQELAQVQNELADLRAVNRELRQSVREMEQDAELQQFRKLDNSLHSEIQQILNSAQSTLSHGDAAGTLGPEDTAQQVRLQAIELTAVREEVTTLREMALIEDGDQLLQQAIASRDQAIGRKNEMEMELERGRIEQETLSRQLLQTIEQKIELAQQLEEWQEDMQVVISQQLRSQHQREGRMALRSSPEKDRVAPARDSGGFLLRFRKR